MIFKDTFFNSGILKAKKDYTHLVKRLLKGPGKIRAGTDIFGLEIVMTILCNYFFFRHTGTVFSTISVTETAEIWFAQIYSPEVRVCSRVLTFLLELGGNIFLVLYQMFETPR